MPGRLGLDFGTSNTVLAAWDEQKQDASPMHVPDLGCRLSGRAAAALIPSLIHYGEGNRRWIGQQVEDKDLLASDRTFSLMKRYIGHRSPVARRIDGRAVTFFEAGKDFLTAVLLYAREELKAGGEDIAITVPVESYEHYTEWLATVAADAGISGLRFIDEASASALGYGAHIQPGQVYLIFDFGGGTLDVSAALIEDQAEMGRRCRILAKAGRDLGGSSLDQWLFQDALKQCGRNELDEDVRSASRALLLACRRVKERLSDEPSAEFSVEGGLTARFTRERLEQILDEHDLFAQIDQTIRRVLNTIREKGFSEDNIQAVFMVGGTCLIPSVEKSLQRIFGRDKVRLDRPMDAVARGAAAFASGQDFYDHIQHDYAVRWMNPQKGAYEYRTIIKKGTLYPTTDAVAKLTIKGTYAGQSDLGIAVFELGDAAAESRGFELVFDPSGAARTVQISADEQEKRTKFWINETTPTFLKAFPPAIPGEARFAVEFGVDANKRLLISARDLKSGEAVLRDHPVIKLR